ncbi:hypothetical protein CkaCkLH20_09035 [Colletotrichum karsti]|uniref:DNA (cytosine-5-)-methyltransferase n=1 Tax=Colletotrichum karsti TaxID=1095194 RepID=A0A9P6I3Z7_9PEZI|nr:uncharacterized protein CkaCkLH20_09035 [Colletotrichum karsti]KAF9873576.1 hypothetical protein CkaCkLH20_09035 [Colletotrichum karsti]
MTSPASLPRKRNFFTSNVYLSQSTGEPSARQPKTENEHLPAPPKRKGVRSAGAKNSLRRVAIIAQRPAQRSTGTPAGQSEDTSASTLISAVCIAESFNMGMVLDILRAHGFDIDPDQSGFEASEVVHARGVNGGDIFVFPSGTIVTWTLPPDVVTKQLLSAAETPLKPALREVEDLEYVADSSRETSGMKGDIVVLGTKLEEREGDRLDTTLAKIAFSSGLARSTKLAVLETALTAYFESTRKIPSLLSKGSGLPLGRKFILQKTGELLSLRARLNHYSELTDSLPDIFWDSRAELGLEGYYEQVGRALDVNVRIRTLNQKMDYAQEIASVLREMSTLTCLNRVRYLLWRVSTPTVAGTFLDIYERSRECAIIMPGPIEDYDDGLAPEVYEADVYDEDQDWEVDEDLAKIENRKILQVLENATHDADANVDSQPQLSLAPEPAGEHIPPQTVFLPATFQPITNISVNIPESTLISPGYLYQGEDGLPAPPERETRAVDYLLEEYQRFGDQNDDFIEFDLDQFTIYTEPYTPGSGSNTGYDDYGKLLYPAELRPLHHLSTKSRCTQMYVDGVLSTGEKQYFIRQVPFDELPIGNYGVSEHSVGSDIWIRSKMNARLAVAGRRPDVYYRLGSPSKEYARFHKGFLWVADLAKHVTDYLSTADDRRVVLRDFESHFSEWLSENHQQDSEAFKHWRNQFPSADFRSAIVANLEFIYKEVNGVLGHKARSIHMWKEIRDYTAYPDVSRTPASAPSSPSSAPGKASHIEKTVVTPYINQLFNHLPCGMMMDAVSPSPETDRLRTEINDRHNLESAPNVHTSANPIEDRRRSLNRDIQIGDVISTPRDNDDDSHWAREVAAGFDDVDRWFGLVQKIYKRNGDQSFDVIWLYRPVDTLCGSMRYPWNNELFLSDHCSCHDGHHKIKQSEVLAIHQIHWGGSSSTDAEFFCRQTYLTLTETHRWVTFQEHHLRCRHSPDDVSYKVGETFLVRIDQDDDTVEPCELVSLSREEDEDLLTFRLLYRRDQLEPHSGAPPNELVYSNDLIKLQSENIHGKCIVRFFQPDKPIPCPYNRRGVANAFYITRQRLESGQIVPMTDASPIDINIHSKLRQGFDPSRAVPKLRGVDLFCGGGNFGRGLEEGGVIEMKWANDINDRAIHTYMANATAGSVQPFVGSIDDLQRLALEGKFSEKVPKVGQVDFVSAGSPCPGFSRLTNDKTKLKQRKNQSLVAAFASFVDTYRPKFGVLENVVEIVQDQGKRKEDVFCQLICAIVGLGYQAHFFLLDAWSHGSPQSRSRVFLCFAAPDYRLPEMPLHSHSHYQTFRSRTLGKLPNGEPMGQRLFMPTPFKFVTAEEATADLPDIADGKADCCISFPDHRFASGHTKSFRNQLSAIPTRPYGMNFVTSWNNGKGVMTEAERGFFPDRGHRVLKSSSRAWGRSFPNTIMPTITTTPSPADAWIGRILHRNQNRTFTVMEARRAQGFLDHEVLLGAPRDQWKVIGNSVAREVSLVLGLAFREAWLGSLIDGEEKTEPAFFDSRHALMNTPISRSRTPNSDSDTSSGSSRAAKRPLSSTLEVQMFVSKMAKTSRGQTVTDGRTETTEADLSEDSDCPKIVSDISGRSKKRSQSRSQSRTQSRTQSASVVLS